jgi:hypothetical protein
MGQPTVPIDVDAETGIWRTDGLPMVYLPRHFLVNNHLAVEEALGVDAYRRILRVATDKSAVHWCRSESRTHGFAAEQTFRHYFQRLSQRGWGQFQIDELDLQRGHCSMNLAHSVFALERREPAAFPVCYMFEGFLTGALRYLLGRSDDANIECAEVRCAAQGHHELCRFESDVSEG